MSARLPLQHLLRRDKFGHIARDVRSKATAETYEIDRTIAAIDRTEFREPWLEALARGRQWMLERRRDTIVAALKGRK